MHISAHVIEVFVQFLCLESPRERAEVSPSGAPVSRVAIFSRPNYLRVQKFHIKTRCSHSYILPEKFRGILLTKQKGATSLYYSLVAFYLRPRAIWSGGWGAIPSRHNENEVKFRFKWVLKMLGCKVSGCSDFDAILMRCPSVTSGDEDIFIKICCKIDNASKFRTFASINLSNNGMSILSMSMLNF